MKRGFMGSSKKEPADLRTIRKSTKEESIDTLQAASIDSVNHASNDTIQLVSDNTVHHGTVQSSIVHDSTVHQGTVYLDTIHPASIDTVYPLSIDTVHSPSIDTFHPSSIDTVHRDIVHPDTVHHDCVNPDTVYPVKNDTSCGETEMIEVLIRKVDENGMSREEEGRTRNSTEQLINAQGAVIPDMIVVVEMNDFDLSREWYD